MIGIILDDAQTGVFVFDEWLRSLGCQFKLNKPSLQKLRKILLCVFVKDSNGIIAPHDTLYYTMRALVLAYQAIPTKPKLTTEIRVLTSHVEQLQLDNQKLTNEMLALVQGSTTQVARLNAKIAELTHANKLLTSDNTKLSKRVETLETRCLP